MVLAMHLLAASFIITEAFAPPESDHRQNNANVHILRSSKTDEDAAAAVIVGKTNPRRYGLALQLDEGTRKSHSVAENTAFVTGFFKGISKPESYRNLLTSLYYIYKAMEEDAFDTTKDDRVKKLDDQALRRLEALQRDMAYFHGDDTWQSHIPPPSPATKTYVAHIQKLVDKPENSYLLIAHQYTRYLGDLFGGQMMGGMAQRTMNLPAGKGVAFYTFDDITCTKDYITSWYQRLNDLNLTEKQKQHIVDEANLVFELNIGILEELEGSPLTSLWNFAISSLKEKLGMR
jgi:heme oxygenase